MPCDEDAMLHLGLLTVAAAGVSPQLVPLFDARGRARSVYECVWENAAHLSQAGDSLLGQSLSHCAAGAGQCRPTVTQTGTVSHGRTALRCAAPCSAAPPTTPSTRCAPSMPRGIAGQCRAGRPARCVGEAWRGPREERGRSALGQPAMQAPGLLTLRALMVLADA